jgi:hypothetical protein
MPRRHELAQDFCELGSKRQPIGLAWSMLHRALMALKRVAALGLVLVACGDDEPADGRGKEAIQKTPHALCDGSDGVRLALVSGGGGPLPDDHAFSNPYGWRFLYVDGDCHFVANSEEKAKLLTGTFSAEQGQMLSDALGLEATTGILYQFQNTCPDAPANFVITPDAFIQTGCGDDHPPAVVEAAMNWEPAFALAESAGKLSTGPVSIVALPREGTLDSASPWPFAWSIDQVTPTAEDRVSYTEVTKYAKTLSGSEATTARELWGLAAPTEPWANYVPVTSAGKTYMLYFRDELEASSADKILKFRTTHGLDAARPIALCDESRVLATSGERNLYSRVVNANVGEDVPCGVELCWNGSFDESYPVQAGVRLQKPAQERTCLGNPSLSVSADLQPMIDAFRASYPRTPVEIDLGFGMLLDSEGDDALCRALSVESCASDPRCAPIKGSLNDAARACSVPNVALGCGAKTQGCDGALTGGQAPDGRRAVFTSGCIPQGWTRFYGEAPDYALPVCAP